MIVDRTAIDTFSPACVYCMYRDSEGSLLTSIDATSRMDAGKVGSPRSFSANVERLLLLHPTSKGKDSLMVTPLPVIAGAVIEISVLGTMADAGSKTTPAGFKRYYRRSVVGAVINKTNIKAIFSTTVITPLLAAANSGFSPNSVNIRRLDDATDQVVNVAVAGTGAILTDAAQSQSTVVVKLQTIFRGKNGRGFTHLPAVNEADTLRNVLTGGGLTNWQAVGTALGANMTDADGNTWVPIVFSRVGSQVRVNPTTIRGGDVSQVFTRKVLGTMRKRKARIIL